MKARLFTFLLMIIATTTLGSQGAPKSIKYQAIIRDIQGHVVANNDQIRMKISILAGSPAGSAVYSETHHVSSNAFGLVNFEIGQGVPGSGYSNSFAQIAWGDDIYFVMMELDINQTGFTFMNTSQLVSVPYALYADRAGDVDFQGLTHNYLTRYDGVQKRLVDALIDESTPGQIRFYGQYTFPKTIGTQGYALSIIDASTGELGWRAASGGGGGIDDTHMSDGYIPFFNKTQGYFQDSKAHMVGQVLELTGQTTFKAPVQIDDNLSVNNSNSSFTGSMNMTGNIQIDGSVSGNNNLMLNSLQPAHVWIGNNSGIATQQTFKGALSVQADGTAILLENDPKVGSLDDTYIPVWDATASLLRNADLINETDGIAVINQKRLRINDYHLPSTAGSENQFLQLGSGNEVRFTDLPAYRLRVSSLNDFLSLDSSNKEIIKVDINGHWLRTNDDIRYRYAGRVGIGQGPSDAVSATLHVEGGSLLVKSSKTNNQPLPHQYSNGEGGMMWYAGKRALRMGYVDNAESSNSSYNNAWSDVNIGQGSIALGVNTIAKSPKSFAIGEQLFVEALNADPLINNYGCFAIGYNSKVGQGSSFTLGIDNNIQGKQSMALGSHNIISTGSSGTTVGQNNEIADGASTSTLVGNDNISGTLSSRVSGFGIANSIGDNAQDVLSIGHSNSIQSNSSEIINIGFSNNLSDQGGIGIGKDITLMKGIALGRDITGRGNSVNIGINIQTPTINEQCVYLGHDITYTIDDGVVNAIGIGGGLTFDPFLNPVSNSIAIGTQNTISEGNNVTIGTYLHNNHNNCVLIGNNYIEANGDGLASPAFIVSNNSFSLMYMTSDGDLYLNRTASDGEYGQGNIHGNQGFFSGAVQASELTTPSDRDLKYEFQALGTVGSILDSIRPYFYKYVSDEHQKLRSGFIAQDVETYFPHLVGRSGYYRTLNYVDMIPILWKVAQEQSDLIKKQDTEIQKLKQALQSIEERLERLETP